MQDSTPQPAPRRQTPPEGKAKPKRQHRGLIATMWIVFAACVAGIFIFFFFVYNGAIGYMPPVEELKNPTDRFASVLYSSDGKEIGRYFSGTGNRVYADFDEVSPHVIDALIATEDVRFEEHSGIDFIGLGRVLVKTVLLGNKNAGGGSTLTQQLAKQLYSPESKGFLTRAMQKPIEWMIAVKLERYYSKDEIIKMYLNQFDFLYNAVGIKSAAHVYFDKTPGELNIEEAATLVGMVKNPAYYNPVRQNERTRQRRNVVLSQMEKAGKITAAECDSLSALPLTLTFNRVDAKDGIAPYFREELRRMLRAKRPERANYRGWENQKFVDDSIAWETNPLYGWIEKNPKPDGSHYDIYTDGLKIYTTIDSRMQEYAEEAVSEHLSELQKAFFREKRGTKNAPYTTDRAEISEIRVNHLIRNALRNTDRYRMMVKAGASKEEIDRAFNTPREMKIFSYNGSIDTVMTPRDSVLWNKHFLRTGFMAMDPRNGHIKAYVGGPDFSYFQYDMVSTGRRQIGSTVKPFLYAYAMEEGYTPCDVFENSQPVLTDENGRPWAPRNAGSARVGEMVNLRWALTNSNNWISARLISQLSPSALVRTMHNFGITSQLPAVMSLCLGPADVSVKEMVTAYSAFANNGMRVDPQFVTAIADNKGNIISEFSPRHTEVISEKAYYRILSMLLNVVDEGTAHRVRSRFGLTAEMGGKTGTTNYNADGWFMGFTPDLVAGTWVGGEERYIHFNTMAYGQGAAMALPVYGRFMKKVYADKELGYSQQSRFEFPAGLDLCQGQFSFDEEVPDADTDAQETSIDGIFD